MAHRRKYAVVKLQSLVQTSHLGLGVDFVSPLSQQEEQDHEPPPKSIWSLTLKTKSCLSYGVPFPVWTPDDISSLISHLGELVP